MTTEQQQATAASRTIVVSRLINAPRERVWHAWTDPEHMMRWWGPQHFTAPSCRIDLRVGGSYLFCMRSPEGQDFWSTGVYREIVPHERIVYTDCFADEHGNVVPASYYGMDASYPLETLVTVQLEDVNGQTKLTIFHANQPDTPMTDGAKIGWAQSLDKLAASVE